MYVEFGGIVIEYVDVCGMCIEFGGTIVEWCNMC